MANPVENQPGITPIIDYTPYKVFNGAQTFPQGIVAKWMRWHYETRKTRNFPDIGISGNSSEVYLGKGTFSGKFNTPLFMNYRGGYFDAETTPYEYFQAGYDTDEEIFNSDVFAYYNISPMNFQAYNSLPKIAKVKWLPNQTTPEFEVAQPPLVEIVDVGTPDEMNAKYNKLWQCQKAVYYPSALPSPGQYRQKIADSEYWRILKRFPYDTVFNVWLNSYIGQLTYLPGNGGLSGDALISIDDFFMSSYNPAIATQLGFNCQKSIYGTQLQGAMGVEIFTYVPSSVQIGDTILADFSLQYVGFPSRELIVALLNDIGIAWTSNIEEAYDKPVDEFDEFEPTGSGQGENGTGGGNGTGDNSSDNITTDPPKYGSLSSGNRYYALSQNELADFSEYLWTSKWYENLDLILNDPAEGVVKLQMFPFDVSAHDSSAVGGNTEIVIGNVTLIETYGALIDANYNQTFNMGSIKIDEYFGSFLDYSPYTKIDIWLPYIGFKELDVQLIMGKTLKVDYVVDVAAGACTALIWADTKLLYTYSGSIGVDIPLTSSNSAAQSANALVGGLGLAAGVATTILSGGMGAAVGVGIAASAAANVANNKTHINKGGTASAQNAFYAPQYCYLVIERPIQSLPANYSGFKGYPSNTTQILSNCQGYFEVDSVILDNISCSQVEKDMLLSELQGGVILR